MFFVKITALSYNSVTMTTRALATDEQYIRLALKMARRGLGKVSPNPMVGAVIVKRGRIIAQGYHRAFGADHAEVDAFKKATEDVRGATLYVTLEPCTHYGKTPPCIDVIIQKKIGRVVIGMQDPDKRVNGRSITILKEKGIAVTAGVLESECQALNETYVKHRSTGLPFVTVKWAQTVDGRIATAQGRSRWIASPESLKLAHRLRATHDAILVGAGTVLKDDPELTTRLVKGRNPLRVVLDSNLKIPPEVKVFADQSAARTVVATTAWDAKEKLAALKATGLEVLITPPDPNGQVDLKALLKTLGERDISSVLVEGGAETITSFLRQGLADRVIAIIAPKIMGRGTDAVGELNITDMSQVYKLVFKKVYRSGEDIVVEGERTHLVN
jgi:diaminohydroxyphosphoribosylaminopyrimidine deaminase/5-amino-6-(5-phosphoribosylamino)uracil reductase